MTRLAIEIDLLALDAEQAGEHIWRAIELSRGFGSHDPIGTFHAAVEQVADAIRCAHATSFFTAHARLALSGRIPDADYQKLDIAAAEEHAAYERHLIEQERYDIADFRRRQAREAV